jgi:hypothetical protein
MFDSPPKQKIQDLVGGGPPLLLVVIDTEEEFDWSRPHSRESTAVTSLASQTAAQEIFETRGLVPTYVVDYPVATSDLAREVLVPWAAAGRCIIGAHLHPWVNPPFEEAVSAYNSYPGNLPADLERRKLEVLTEAIEETFGKRPDIYKAGRYGLGQNSASTLDALGYRVDMSVVPYSSFGDDGGPDFTAFDFWPFWFGGHQGLLEIPLACGFCGRLKQFGPRLYPHLIHRGGMRLHLPGVFARTGLLERIRLTPEGVDLASNKRLTQALLDQGCKVFTFTYHSPSLTPGMTPYVRDRSDFQRFLDELDSYLDHFLGELGGRASTPYEIYDRAQQSQVVSQLRMTDQHDG